MTLHNYKELDFLLHLGHFYLPIHFLTTAPSEPKTFNEY